MIRKVERLERRVNEAAKHPELVLRLDAPGHRKDETLNYLNVIHDEEERLFEMGYGTERWTGRDAGGVASRLSSSASRDGIRWDKPKLGLFEAGGSREHNFVCGPL